MKAAVIDEYGPSSVLQIRDVDQPSVADHQVLIEIHAAAVNPIDWKIRNGEMSFRFGQDFPKILGFDASGVVSKVGAKTEKFKVGDEVYVRSDVMAGGTYAEYVAVGESVVALKSKRLSHLEAAAMPLAVITALQGLRDCGNLSAGDRVLIVGASGGVGTYAVQIAKALGAHVTGVCSTNNLELVGELGADRVIDYTKESVLETDEPYDVIYDTIGTQKPAVAREALKESGVYMTLVPVDGAEWFVPGETERAPQAAYFVMCTPNGDDLALLAGWADEGKLRSVIDSVFTLDDIAAAHERSQTLHARGKIVIQVKT